MKQLLHSTWPGSRIAGGKSGRGSAHRHAGAVFAFAFALSWLLSPAAHAASLSVIEEAAQAGERGMRVTLDDGKPGYVQDDSPSAQRQYRARFYLRTDNLKMRDGDVLAVFAGYTAGGESAVYLTLRQDGTSIRLGAGARLSNHLVTSVEERGETVLAPGWHLIEFYWLAAKDLSSANGYLSLWVDGASQTGLSRLANSTLSIDYVRLGAVHNVASTMTGRFDIDEFVSRPKDRIGATPTTTGISDVAVQENAPNTVVQLFPVFADAETADAALALTVLSNTNAALFSTAAIDPATGAFTLDYATGLFGDAEITVRATDSDGLYVDSTFAVTVAENRFDVNNDGQTNAVDVQLVINDALGLPADADADIDKDGKTNAVDVQLVINGALGLVKRAS